MSTENEGTAVPADHPAAPSTPSTPPTPPTPPTTPSASVPAAEPAPAPTPSDAPTVAQSPVPEAPPAQAQAPAPAPEPTATVPTPTPAAAGAGWPPPPPTVPAWGAPLPPAPAAPAAPRRRTGGLVAAVLVAALVAGGIGGGIGYWAAQRGDEGVSSTTVSSGEAPASFKREPGTVAAVAAKALPSVVTIQAKSGGSQGEGGTGTGFVYDQEGHIVTNNHVVASAADGGTWA
ncbi:protease, partial [Streptomyces massasporeus]